MISISERDVTSRQGRQMLELTASERSLLLNKAEKLHQHPGEVKEATSTASEMTRLLENSHLLHFVYTPLLFLPKWRYKAHSTRLRDSQNRGLEECEKLPSTEGADRKKLRISAIEEREHSSILKSYMGDYLRYLKTLGFSRVRTKEEIRTDKSKASFFAKNPRRNRDADANSYFVKKSLPNGTLYFEVGICEPFVFMKFYGLETSRLPNDYQNEFLSPKLSNEIFDIQKSLHMHSFTFDFHLRTIGKLLISKMAAG